ncbi:hypothetical protein HZH68_007568 [Vespula germanica]|uniref:Uncharacterized protein n=1 Tax=Vespula germanica TaxID=30212 RepID=A0A834NBV7_VESGE|nr:hypothetical protein HZH68_007568 [Vespula germanica]
MAGAGGKVGGERPGKPGRNVAVGEKVDIMGYLETLRKKRKKKIRRKKRYTKVWRKIDAKEGSRCGEDTPGREGSFLLDFNESKDPSNRAKPDINLRCAGGESRAMADVRRLRVEERRVLLKGVIKKVCQTLVIARLFSILNPMAGLQRPEKHSNIRVLVIKDADFHFEIVWAPELEELCDASCTSMHVSPEAAPYDNAELYDKEQFNGLVKDTKHAYRDKSEAQYGGLPGVRDERLNVRNSRTYSQYKPPTEYKEPSKYLTGIPSLIAGKKFSEDLQGDKPASWFDRIVQHVILNTKWSRPS